MLTYAEARDALIEHLTRDAAMHDAERYDEIGRRFDHVEHLFPHGTAPELTKLHVALSFWDGWIDARNHGWQGQGNVKKDEWPALARSVVADLAADRDITDRQVSTRFDIAAHSGIGERAQILAARLRGR
jgi:hypothetical protein